MDRTNEKKKYYVVTERAVPEVLQKVVEAKKLQAAYSLYRKLQSRQGSAAALFTNIKMIFFLSMNRPKERQLPLSYRWMMNLGYCQMY